MRTRRLAATLAGLMIAGASVPVDAQSSIFVSGPTGSKADVWVTLLGGSASLRHQMYLFRNPLNFSAPAGGEAVGARKGANDWAPSATEIYLGRFDAGSELVFGLLFGNDNWFFSGAGSRNWDGDAHLAKMTGPVYRDGGRKVIAGTESGDVYGWEDIGGARRDNDYNDFVFGMRTATVNPEPATMALLATGLAAMGGAARARRRRKES